MRALSVLSLALFCVDDDGPVGSQGRCPGAQAPMVKIPKPGVPQIMTIEGKFVRAAYNNEGYAILGYQLANISIGEEWMLLEFGTTVLDDVRTTS